MYKPKDRVQPLPLTNLTTDGQESCKIPQEGIPLILF